MDGPTRKGFRIHRPQGGRQELNTCSVVDVVDATSFRLLPTISCLQCSENIKGYVFLCSGREQRHYTMA